MCYRLKTCCRLCRPETGSKIVAFAELILSIGSLVVTSLLVGSFHLTTIYWLIIALIMFTILVTGIFQKIPALLMIYLVYTGMR